MELQVKLDSILIVRSIPGTHCDQLTFILRYVITKVFEVLWDEFLQRIIITGKPLLK